VITTAEFRTAKAVNRSPFLPPEAAATLGLRRSSSTGRRFAAHLLPPPRRTL